MKDMSGFIFGRLRVVCLSHFKSGRAYWKCQCSCGNTSIVCGGELNRATKPVRSCGCLHREGLVARNTKHGLRGTNTYSKWRMMRARIRESNKPKNTCYKHVKICARWNDFNAFLLDMGECPPGLTLDRIDNSKGYEPTNCRWATRSVQARNKTNARLITAHGQTLCMSAWAEKTGISVQTIAARLTRGWPDERAVSE